MKKIYNTIYLVAICIALAGCSDFTEFDRDFILAEEGSIENVTDLERLLLGTYNANQSYGHIISYNSISSDELRIGLGNRGQGLQAHSFTFNSGSGQPENAWNSLYDVIDNANRILRLADNLGTDTPEEAQLLEQIRGEAVAIRAWQYFDLLRMFAPTFGDPSSPGVPLVTEVLVVGESSLDIPRNTVGEVLEQINLDFNVALSILTDNNPNNLNRITPLAIEAFQARLALYSGSNTDLTEAVAKATTVINSAPLAAGQDYIDMFRADPTNPDVNSEVLLQIERDQFDAPVGSVGRLGTIYSDVNQDVFFSMSVDLLGAMQGAGDDRFNTNIDLETDITARTATNDEIIVGKYLGSSELISLNNIKVLRVSEMYLIRAEANARLNNLEAANNDIQSLRSTRGSTQTTPAAYANADEALVDILAERRVELAFEGHRILDLKRFGQGVNRIAEDCEGDGRPATTCNLEENSFRFTFPIPQSEIFANDGISNADQNPGY